jgi:hypothetical protein
LARDDWHLLGPTSMAGVREMSIPELQAIIAALYTRCVHAVVVNGCCQNCRRAR